MGNRSSQAQGVQEISTGDAELLARYTEPINGGVPDLAQGETSVLRRDGIKLRVKGSGLPVNVPKKGQGSIFLTTKRLIFVPKGRLVSPFEVGLKGITNEQFNQPVFGANSISGVSQEALGVPVRWNFTFTTGGVGTFLHVFQATLHYVRVTLHRSGRLVDARAELIGPHMDPMDPSRVWLAEAVVLDGNDDAARQPEPAYAATATPAATAVAQPTVQPLQAAQPATATLRPVSSSPVGVTAAVASLRF